MLIIDAGLESVFSFGIERQQIEIIVGAAMQDTTLPVHGGIDGRVVDSAILGLHVNCFRAYAQVAVVPEQHW